MVWAKKGSGRGCGLGGAAPWSRSMVQVGLTEKQPPSQGGGVSLTGAWGALSSPGGAGMGMCWAHGAAVMPGEGS